MPFKPGESGNPGGRPKDLAWVKELARRRTEDAIRTLGDIMLDVDMDGRTRVAAAQALLDRAWGKPSQAITGDDGGPVKIDASAGLYETLKKMAGQ